MKGAVIVRSKEMMDTDGEMSKLNHPPLEVRTTIKANLLAPSNVFAYIWVAPVLSRVGADRGTGGWS